MCESSTQGISPQEFEAMVTQIERALAACRRTGLMLALDAISTIL